MQIEDQTIITLTADIVAAHVENNNVSVNDVAGLIQEVYKALSNLGAPVEPAVEALKPAAAVRTSITPDHLVSLIDGKPYKALKRHLTMHGYTPDSYREAFNLPANYPMVAANYSAMRSAMSKKLGLGRKRVEAIAPVEAAKPIRKTRKSKAKPAEIPSKDK